MTGEQVKAVATPPTGVRILVGLLTALTLVGCSLEVAPSVSVQVKAHPALLQDAEDGGRAAFPLIVRESDPSSPDAEGAVERLGGTVIHQLPIVGGFSARLPGASLPGLLSSPSVARVWGDGRVHMSGHDDEDPDSWTEAWKKSIRLPRARRGVDGSGVTVALLDTGITQVADLEDRVLARVDFTPDQDGYDRYGHGTHMAGIIAGDGSLSGGTHAGVAPGASLVSVKVASADGATDVSVVIAGMQWILAHRSQYDIRIMNLSFGTDSTQSYLVDPLDFAVEQIWLAGIFVVVAAGNRGLAGVSKPADDPFVVTVGAADVGDTKETRDDVVASFSGRGPTQDAVAKPDLVAPGVGIVSNRAPGSTLDGRFPAARIGDDYFRGTGTSQASAVVSGVAALMLDAEPTATPDVLKAALVGTAGGRIARFDGAGAGMVDAQEAVKRADTGFFRRHPANRGIVPSTGLGSLELSRGSLHVRADLDGDDVMDVVSGEIDVLGNPWSPSSWLAPWSANSWSMYVSVAEGWGGNSWSGDSWSGDSWSGNSWNGNSWGVAELGLDTLVLRYGNSWS